jgi:predicted RecB family nuclease
VQSWHTTVLYFAAAAIEHSVGHSPLVGYICLGETPEIKSVRLPISHQHLSVLREMAATLKAAQPPSIQLNPHCPICRYRMRCRQNAIDEDNLSLVSSIPPKERRKLEAKGIKTITQLSYTYRPRRKRRPRATPELSTL